MGRPATAFSAGSPQAEALISEIWLRFLYFLARLAINSESILGQWKLFNSASQFTWAGTYYLGTDTTAKPPLPRTTSFAYNAKAGTLMATLQFAETLPKDLDIVVGIIILGKNGVPLDLNYTNLNGPPTTRGTSLTQAINLTGVTLTGCKAAVFVNLEKLPQEYAF